MPKGFANKVNEEFFFEWSSDLAYVLGLLATDGYLGDKTGNKKAYQVQLVLTDKDIIDKVAKSIGYEGRIYHRTFENSDPTKYHKKDNWGIKFGNKRVFNRLIELNITPRKTYDLIIPPIPDELFCHFFRGVFDGDGTLSISSNSRTFKIISASYDFQNGLLCKIEEITGIKMNLYKSEYYGNPLYYLAIGNYGDLNKLYKWLYEDNNGNLYLERKRSKFESIISNWTIDTKGYSMWTIRNEHTPEELKELYLNKKKTFKEIANMWEVKLYSIRRIAKEWGISKNKISIT